MDKRNSGGGGVSPLEKPPGKSGWPESPPPQTVKPPWKPDTTKKGTKR